MNDAVVLIPLLILIAALQILHAYGREKQLNHIIALLQVIAKKETPNG